MRGLRIAVVKPGIARNKTAFDAMAELYNYVSLTHHVKIVIFSDECDSYVNGHLDVMELAASRLPKLLRLIGLPAGQFYPSLLHKLTDYDVIIAADPTLYLNHCYLAYLAAKRHKARLLVDLSLTLPTPKFRYGLKDKIKKHMSNQVAQHTSKFLVTTPLATERYQSLGLVKDNSGKFLVLGHPVDTRKFHPSLAQKGSQSKQVSILSVGRLVPEKGFQFVIEALVPIFEKNPYVELRIVGMGSYKSQLEGLISRNHLEQQIQITGPVPHDELPDVYRRADILVGHPVSTPHCEEFFGVVYVEAIACGLPVISSYCGGVPYVVPDGHVGYLVSQRDVAQLTEKLELLIYDKPLRKKLGHQAREYALNHYSVEKLGEKFYSACTGDS